MSDSSSSGTSLAASEGDLPPDWEDEEDEAFDGQTSDDEDESPSDSADGDTADEPNDGDSDAAAYAPFPSYAHALAWTFYTAQTAPRHLLPLVLLRALKSYLFVKDKSEEELHQLLKPYKKIVNQVAHIHPLVQPRAFRDRGRVLAWVSFQVFWLWPEE